MSTPALLPGSVQAAQPGLKGFDSNTIITAAVAAQFVSDGFSFCARYLSSRGSGQGSHDLSNAEAITILNAGLSLIAVQHVAAYGWVPSQQLGTEYGTNAANNALSIGLPRA